ncbi:MAG: hypothetical protein M3070_09190 [Actinomycetota bacterium]|nr:hypothetical protein [Actinomycetota bacterium]
MGVALTLDEGVREPDGVRVCDEGRGVDGPALRLGLGLGEADEEGDRVGEDDEDVEAGVDGVAVRDRAEALVDELLGVGRAAAPAWLAASTPAVIAKTSTARRAIVLPPGRNSKSCDLEWPRLPTLRARKIATQTGLLSCPSAVAWPP